MWLVVPVAVLSREMNNSRLDTTGQSSGIGAVADFTTRSLGTQERTRVGADVQKCSC